MEILRVIVITLAASIIALGIGALVSQEIGKSIAISLGYGNASGAAAALLANCTSAGRVPCSAVSTAMGTFTTVASFFAIIAIAMLGWYVISLFAGGKQRV